MGLGPGDSGLQEEAAAWTWKTTGCFRPAPTLVGDQFFEHVLHINHQLSPKIQFKGVRVTSLILVGLLK